MLRVERKGGKEGMVYGPRELIRRIKDTFGDSVWLFGHHGRHYTPEGMTTRIRALGERILGRRITAHTFRHSFATWSQEQGVPLGKLSRYLGHSDIRTTAVFYDHSTVTPGEALSVAVST